MLKLSKNDIKIPLKTKLTLLKKSFWKDFGNLQSENDLKKNLIYKEHK